MTPITLFWAPSPSGKVRVSLADTTVVWAGHGLQDFRRLHVSKNSGVSFSPTAVPATMNPRPGSRISGLATHPTEAGTAYAMFSQFSRPKVLETKDYGDTWTDLSGFAGSSGQSANGFPDVGTYDLLVIPHAPNIIWVGTDIGLFESRTYGATWSYADNGLPAVSIWQMKLRDDEVVLATHGRGVWTVPVSEIRVSITDDSADLPDVFSLAQNYPNPFNSSTTISFSVPEEAPIRISVFDALGRRVDVLADQVFAAGTYTLNWNANGQASGTYFYRMESRDRLIQAHQMMLVK